MVCPGQIVSINSNLVLDKGFKYESASVIEGANNIKLFDACLRLRKLIFLTADWLKASQPIPQTPSVG